MPVAKLPMPVAARPVRFLGVAAGLTSVVTLVAAGMPSSPRELGSSVPGGRFLAVNALSPADAWAVGDVYNSTSGALNTLAAHWDGTRWVRVPSPSPGVQPGGSSLVGVSAASASDVWAVGYYENGSKVDQNLVVHWNGTRWTQVPSPSPGAGDLLNGVTALSATDAWAVGGTVAGGVGQNLVLHWDGTHWTQVPSPSPGGKVGSGLGAVSAVSPSGAWAVGCYGFNPNTGASSTLALRWDGTRWTQVPTPSPGNPPAACLSSVSALSANDAWAVGHFSPSLTSGAQKPLVLHWDGTRWAQVASPAPGDTLVTALNGVAAISPSDAWAVGDVFNGTTQTQRTLVFHWDGTGWTHVPAPSPGFATLYGVAGVSASDAWAVGQGNNSLILRWDGSRWTQS